LKKKFGPSSTSVTPGVVLDISFNNLGNLWTTQFSTNSLDITISTVGMVSDWDIGLSSRILSTKNLEREFIKCPFDYYIYKYKYNQKKVGG
jgi:hypothetical protein